MPVIAWILKGAIDGVPIEIEEAARIDGCSRLGIVMTVVVPLIAPDPGSGGRDRVLPWLERIRVRADLDHRGAVAHRLRRAWPSFVGELSTPIDAVMAVAVIYTLPAVVFYLIVQRHVVSGMTAGSVKG